MKLEGTICGRCHNEVLAPFSLTCTLPSHPCHHYDAANNADPGPIAAEPHDILDGITQMEEMLCSLASSPCFVMWVSKGRQYKTRWNIITFAQDIASPSARSTDKTIPMLPPPPPDAARCDGGSTGPPSSTSLAHARNLEMAALAVPPPLDETENENIVGPGPWPSSGYSTITVRPPLHLPQGALLTLLCSVHLPQATVLALVPATALSTRSRVCTRQTPDGVS